MPITRHWSSRPTSFGSAPAPWPACWCTPGSAGTGPQSAARTLALRSIGWSGGLSSEHRPTPWVWSPKPALRWNDAGERCCRRPRHHCRGRSRPASGRGPGTVGRLVGGRRRIACPPPCCIRGRQRTRPVGIRRRAGNQRSERPLERPCRPWPGPIPSTLSRTVKKSPPSPLASAVGTPPTRPMCLARRLGTAVWTLDGALARNAADLGLPVPTRVPTVDQLGARRPQDRNYKKRSWLHWVHSWRLLAQGVAESPFGAALPDPRPPVVRLATTLAWVPRAMDLR
jgi:hypothetical protein